MNNGDAVFRYDILNRLVEYGESGDTQRFEYRGLQWHRRGQYNNGSAIVHLYDDDNVVADYGSGGTLVYHYVSPEKDLYLSMTFGNDTFYYTQDGIHNVQTLTDHFGNLANKYDYLAFGSPYDAVSSITTQQRYGFQGRETDKFGKNMFFRYRNYLPRHGVFTTADPAGYENNPLGNLYEFVESRPQFLMDPDGLGKINQWNDAIDDTIGRLQGCCDTICDKDREKQEAKIAVCKNEAASIAYCYSSTLARLRGFPGGWIATGWTGNLASTIGGRPTTGSGCANIADNVIKCFQNRSYFDGKKYVGWPLIRPVSSLINPAGIITDLFPHRWINVTGKNGVTCGLTLTAWEDMNPTCSPSWSYPYNWGPHWED